MHGVTLGLFDNVVLCRIAALVFIYYTLLLTENCSPETLLITL